MTADERIRHPQSGSVLAVALILLLAMAMAGLASLQDMVRQQEAAGSTWDRYLAFQAAEAALRSGERWLDEAANQALADGGKPLTDPPNWTGRYPAPSGRVAPFLGADGAEAPVFHVGPPQLARVGITLPPAHRRIYPVTALGRGIRRDDASPDATAVVLQSMVEPPPVGSPDDLVPQVVLRDFAHPDLGRLHGEPAIVTLCSGSRAAIFGNGYDSARRRAVLFVIDLTTGALAQAIDTGVGDARHPNGLGPPATTDWPSLDLRADRVYAGDLLGHLWRFDLACGSDGTLAVVRPTLLFRASDRAGRPQPIRVKPALAADPADPTRIIIAFGSGDDDQDIGRPNAVAHSLYGILDGAGSPDRAPMTRHHLLSQAIVAQTGAAVGPYRYEVRTLTDHPLDPARHRGWHIDLDRERGERVTSPATFPSGPTQSRLRFTTESGRAQGDGRTDRRGYLLDLDLRSGGRTAHSVFDLNRDGVVDPRDMIGGIPVSGVALGDGERLTAIRAPGAGNEYLDAGGGGQDLGTRRARLRRPPILAAAAVIDRGPSAAHPRARHQSSGGSSLQGIHEQGAFELEETENRRAMDTRSP